MLRIAGHSYNYSVRFETGSVKHCAGQIAVQIGAAQDVQIFEEEVEIVGSADVKLGV
jgi:hypothetical protein